MPDISTYLPITNPTLIFFVVMLIILLAPIIMGKLRIPHIIGMVLAGVVIGQYGLDILERDASFELFGKVGLYYIMFLASLEMDMEGLKKYKKRLIIFGLLTCFIPFLMTYVTSMSILGYGITTSLILGCIMASNTLIAYPIVGRYGVQQKPSVTLSVGSSMLSLFIALVILAATVASHNGSSGFAFWLWFFCKFGIFCTLLIYGIPRLTRWFLRRYSDAVMQFIFVMGILFMSAAFSEAIGLEGIFGAFFSGLILNRYIPQVSPLMNRIEFIGNALFIPYFLIGVGMLINVRLLFMGGNIIEVVLCMVIVGTVGKALAAYLACIGFRMPLSSGHMMFGLTSAHAAGAIAMVLVGMGLKTPDGHQMLSDDILNGVIIMILFTCIISTLITEYSAQLIIIRDKEIAKDDNIPAHDEKMLIPVKYPEYADRLIHLALLMRNKRQKQDLVGLNVVYDDIHARKNQEEGAKLLEQIQRTASSADIRMQTQVRIAANIANGIKHAFKEFQASEIIIGMHMHKNVSTKFWGEFHQSLFNGLHRQIIMARIMQPLNTIRRIQVAVPSRAQYEPGFYRWLERLSRMAENLECRILFHGRGDTLSLINEYVQNRHPGVRADYAEMEHWNQLPSLAGTIREDHMFVVITARKGTVSFKSALEKLPEELTNHFSGTNLMIIFPDQYGDSKEIMTFAEAQHHEERSAYDFIREWIEKKVKRVKS